MCLSVGPPRQSNIHIFTFLICFQVNFLQLNCKVTLTSLYLTENYLDLIENGLNRNDSD